MGIKKKYVVERRNCTMGFLSFAIWIYKLKSREKKHALYKTTEA